MTTVFKRFPHIYRVMAERGISLIAGGDTDTELAPLSRVLRTIITAREANRRALDAILVVGEGRAVAADAEKKIEGRGPNWTPEETVEMNRLTDELRVQDERVAELAAQEARDRSNGQTVVQLGAAGEVISVTRESFVYERGNRGVSYFRDLGLAKVGGDTDAAKRLMEHGKQVDVELPKMEAKARRKMEEALSSEEFRGWRGEQRDLTRVDGAGGEFVPPLWMMQEWIGIPRPGRPFIDGARQIPLPAGTDSINLPKLTRGTQVAAQTADNAAVNEQDIQSSSVSAPVNTLAGQQDIPLQLLEQSPLMFDEIIFQDLTEDYDSKLDVQGLNGTGANGQHLGVLNLAGINGITYTDASPTVPELYPKLANGVASVANNRFLPPTRWYMTPNRWFWLASQLDSNNRPFIVPVQQGPQNALAAMGDTVAEGPVGFIFGVPVWLDANIPQALGAGTQDAVLVARMPDLILFEGGLRTRALPEVLSGTLEVRLQVYAYSAWLPGRLPKAISAITGTGLAAPTF